MPKNVSKGANTAARAIQKIGFAIFLLIGMFFLNLSNGSVGIELSSFDDILFQKLPEEHHYYFVFYDLRLPKALAAVLVGLGLSQCGLLMQTYFRNILAGPDILGVSAGASLGVAVYILVDMDSTHPLATLGMVFMAFLGSMAVLLLLILVAARLQSGHALLLGGVLLASFASSATSLLEFFAPPDALQRYGIWSMGTLGGLNYNELGVLAAVILLAVFVLPFCYKNLNALQMGVFYAQSLGVNVRALRVGMLLLSCVITATITAFCGPISFIGVMVPQMARLLLKTSDHRLLMPCSGILGAFILLFCDFLAHSPLKTPVLPLNVLTALLAAPFLVWIIWKGYR